MTTTFVEHLSQVSEAMSLVDESEAEQMVVCLEITKKLNGTVYICGNGGSHATASHFANDLVKQLKLRAVCLGDATSTVFAYGNDNGWSNMYSDPLRSMLKQGDAVVGITCSGNSENVVRALYEAKRFEALTICLTGPDMDSEVSRLGVNALVRVPATDIRVQEDLHLMICHAAVRMMQG